MRHDYLAKVFKLEGYVVEKLEDKGGQIFIYCHAKSRGMWLEEEFSKRMAETKIRCISHMMLEDRQIILCIKQRRFIFKKTRRWEILPNIEKRKQTSNTFRLHTLRELQRDNYSGSGHKRQKSGMFPMKLLDSLPIEAKWEKGIVRIGMDGKAVKGRRLVHHIANLDTGKSIVVFPDLSQEAFKKNCWKYPKRNAGM